MTGWWLATYITLWAVVVILLLAVLGIMREVGSRHRPNLGLSQEGTMAAPEDTGPPMGHAGAAKLLSTHAQGSSLQPLVTCGTCLIMFMTPLCRGCQEIVAAINDIAGDNERPMTTIVILAGDEVTSESFLRLFPLQGTVIKDVHHRMLDAFSVRYTPFGLVYMDGILIAKAVIGDKESLTELVKCSEHGSQSESVALCHLVDGRIGRLSSVSSGGGMAVKRRGAGGESGARRTAAVYAGWFLGDVSKTRGHWGWGTRRSGCQRGARRVLVPEALLLPELWLMPTQ